MIDTTEMTPEKLRNVKECVDSLDMFLEQTPWEIIVWRKSPMRPFVNSSYWSDILTAIEFDKYMESHFPLAEETARYRRMGYVMHYRKGIGWWVEGAKGLRVTKDAYESCDKAWAKASKEIQSLEDAPWRIKLRPLLDS